LRPKPRRALLGIAATAVAMTLLILTALLPPSERGSPLPLLICYALLGAAEVLVIPIAQSELSLHLPAQRAATAIALSYAALAAGFYLAGAIGGLASHIPATQVFTLLAGLAVASGALMTATMKASPQQATG
jgi:predicted MFS family arabinose efflux permease